MYARMLREAKPKSKYRIFASSVSFFSPLVPGFLYWLRRKPPKTARASKELPTVKIIQDLIAFLWNLRGGDEFRISYPFIYVPKNRLS
jgi:hypothetical protein